MINGFFRGCGVLVMLAAVGGCSAVPASGGRVLSFDTQVYVGSVPLKVAVFDTKQKRELGLMHLEGLSEGTGALFVFEKERIVNFWMKNVTFPVDMLFFDKQKKLVRKLEGVQPCKLNKCTSISVKGVQYVLEITSGIFYKKVQMGDVLNVKNPQIQ